MADLAHDRIWRRFTPAQKLARFAVYLVIVAAIVASIRTIEALVSTGASPLAILLKGYWPQVKPAFFSISMFRWDINVRESAVLGLVGAGGIGMALDSALNLFQWNRVAVILLAIFAVVIAAEIVVTVARKRMIQPQ